MLCLIHWFKKNDGSHAQSNLYMFIRVSSSSNPSSSASSSIDMMQDHCYTNRYKTSQSARDLRKFRYYIGRYHPSPNYMNLSDTGVLPILMEYYPFPYSHGHLVGHPVCRPNGCEVWRGVDNLDPKLGNWTVSGGPQVAWCLPTPADDH